MDYVQVRVSYSHSAFPCQPDSRVMDGVSTIQSTIETTAVAALKQCNRLSPWSPSPAPAPNALFSLVAQHWGSEKATEAMQKILSQRSTPRKAAKSSGRVQKGGTPESSTSKPAARAPAKLEAWISAQAYEPSYKVSEVNEHQVESSSSYAPSLLPASESTPCIIDPSGSDLSGLSYHSDMYRGEPSETSSMLRRAGGMDSIRHFLPIANLGMTVSTGARDRAGPGATVRAKRKETSKWGWASWF